MPKKVKEPRGRLSVMVTSAERRQIAEAARIEGLSASAWLRRLALQASRKAAS